MSFAGGAQAHEKSHRTFRNPGLIGCRHNTGIKQGRAFERIFVGEIRTNQKATVLRNLAIARDDGSDVFVTLQENLANFLVPVAKLTQDLIETGVHLVFAQRKNSTENPHGSRRIWRRQKWSN